MPRTRRLAALGAAAVILTVGAAPFLANAADHLDAPSLGSLSAGSLQGDRDINDVYAFDGSNASRTVLAMRLPTAAAVSPSRWPKALRSPTRPTPASKSASSWRRAITLDGRRRWRRVLPNGGTRSVRHGENVNSCCTS